MVELGTAAENWNDVGYKAFWSTRLQCCTHAQVFVWVLRDPNSSLSSWLQIKHITKWAIAQSSWSTVSCSSSFPHTCCIAVGVWSPGSWSFCLHLSHAGISGWATQWFTTLSMAENSWCLLCCLQQVAAILGPSVTMVMLYTTGKRRGIFILNSIA